MVKIAWSKDTPGGGREFILLGRESVSLLKIGDVVNYQLLSGENIQITIDSEFMTHEQAKIGGYEAKFPNTKRYFADIERIQRS